LTLWVSAVLIGANLPLRHSGRTKYKERLMFLLTLGVALFTLIHLWGLRCLP